MSRAQGAGLAAPGYGSLLHETRPGDSGRVSAPGLGHRFRVSLKAEVVRVIGPYVQIGAVRLVGMSRGRRVDCGTCELDGTFLRFDFWSPHLGIAVDVRPHESERETERKADWCYQNKIIYVAPDKLDIAVLAEMAIERRVAQLRQFTRAET